MNPSTPAPAAPAPSGTLAAAMAAAPQDAARLGELLALEFECLKKRDMSGFEALQAERTPLLARLAWVAQWAAEQNPPPAFWQELLPLLQQCKQDHLRNIQLLQRQLQAVKGALQALQGESAATVDLYDRLGQVSRRHGITQYMDA
ncbi:flagellar protein FlgN [Limnohabitans sp.]|uniref:flagellar protein FlgN n=1 Tax=Limnohabitans sp. TaxID=1907725 RepID=UPI0037BE74F9